MIKVELRINEILEEKGLNVAEFSEKSGLAYKTAADIAKNRRDRIGLDTLTSICNGLSVTPAELFKVTEV
jgi:DNA-binding Xre family transcriptional regulator